MTLAALIYCVFVLMNFTAIDDAINCIKLASEVLFRNLILIFQPLYNVVFKILFFAIFGVIILQAMSSAGFSSDDITFAVPDQSGTP